MTVINKGTTYHFHIFCIGPLVDSLMFAIPAIGPEVKVAEKVLRKKHVRLCIH